MTVDVHRIPTLGPQEARRLAAEEYDRFAAVLRDLGPDDWRRPTDCAPWDVRQLIAHVLGATEANAAPGEMIRQLRRGRTGVSVSVDAVSAFQVAERDQLSTRELMERYERAVPRALRWRSRMLRAAGWLPLRVGEPVHETWRLGYLAGVIYTRDVWMHRVDLCRATGRRLALSGAHDGRLVSGVVAEWARRHGRPGTLLLTGPAGGRFSHGEGGDTLSLDAVEFCRAASGRGTPPLDTPVPF